MSGDSSRDFSAAAHASTDVATKAELDSRVASRPTPEVEHQLTPGGGIEMQVHQSVNLENESRIQNLRTRLEERSAALNEQFGQSRMHGKAKADFDRSR